MLRKKIKREKTKQKAQPSIIPKLTFGKRFRKFKDNLNIWSLKFRVSLKKVANFAILRNNSCEFLYFEPISCNILCNIAFLISWKMLLHIYLGISRKMIHNFAKCFARNYCMRNDKFRPKPEPFRETNSLCWFSFGFSSKTLSSLEDIYRINIFEKIKKNLRSSRSVQFAK